MSINRDKALNEQRANVEDNQNLIQTMKKFSHIWVPIFYIFLGAIVVVYSVENPVDSYTARWLTYRLVFRMLRQMLVLVLVAILGAIVTSVPLGILITRPTFKWLAPFVDNPVNIGQTVPSLAILALAFTFIGIGFQTALFALWLYTLLPILRNTSTGLQSVDPGVMEAAKGMGMTPLRIFTRIEFPLALPIIMAGIRTAMVICVGAATLATFIGAGGLGDMIVTGLSMVRYQIVYVGAILAALMALFFDNLLGTLEQYLLQRT